MKRRSSIPNGRGDSPRAGSRLAVLAARDDGHGLAGEGAISRDGHQLAGCLTDRERNGVGRLQDSQDVGDLLAIVPSRTAPADHDPASHVPGG